MALQGLDSITWHGDLPLTPLSETTFIVEVVVLELLFILVLYFLIELSLLYLLTRSVARELLLVI